jgi:hypothetical protein
MDYHIVLMNDKHNWINKLNNVTLYNTSNELETYIQHIIDHYDKLPSYLILLKDNNFTNNVYLTEDNAIQKIEWLLSRFNGEKIGDAIPFFNKPTEEDHYPSPEIRVPDYYYLFFDGSIPNKFEYNQENQYILSRESILNHSKEFYVKIIKMIHTEYKRPSKDSISIPILQRLFPYLFDMNLNTILI